MLDEEAATIDRQLERLVRALNPNLLAPSGVGPLTASTLLVAASDNPERLATKASLATLTGAAPIPASSGQRTRHRLSRREPARERVAAPDRAASHAAPLTTNGGLFRAPPYRGYHRPRHHELKRHIANEIYAALLNPAADDPAGQRLRAQRQRAGIPINVLAATLEVPYQRLRRLEIGTRADPELEARATAILHRINTASPA